MMIKEAAGNKEGQAAASVTQVMFGGSIGNFYLTVPMESLADISKIGGSRKILGEEAYRTYSQMAAENYVLAEYTLRRAVPAWSNPPASYLESNPKLWTVKPVAAAKLKPATPEAKSATTGTR